MELWIGFNGQMFVSLYLSRSAALVLVAGPSVDIDSFACGCGRIFVDLEI